MKRYALILLVIVTVPALAQIPADWHQPLGEQEKQSTREIIEKLRQAPDFPKVERWNLIVNAPENSQINAWETNKQVFVPVEMVRFVKDDQQAFAFLLAHEAGHAKQEELYGQSCYTARNVRYSKFDWFRALADVAGAAATKGVTGAGTALANMQKQVCEDNADAWAVKFTRGAGFDPSAGMRLFEKFQQLHGTNWQQLAQQFSSDHSIEPVRIAHIAVLISHKEQPLDVPRQSTSVSQQAQSTSRNDAEATTSESGSGSLSGEYEGQVHNSTHELTANIDVVVSREVSAFAGCIAIHRPLYGSGELSGESREAQVTFAVSSLAGIIKFSGQREGEDIKGTYTVLQKDGGSQVGEFELHRKTNTLPADFNPKKCPNDFTVR